MPRLTDKVLKALDAALTGSKLADIDDPRAHADAQNWVNAQLDKRDKKREAQRDKREAAALAKK